MIRIVQLKVISHSDNCFKLLLTVSEQKSKIMLISEISEFSIVALGQARKSGKVSCQLQEGLEFSS